MIYIFNIRYFVCMCICDSVAFRLSPSIICSSGGVYFFLSSLVCFVWDQKWLVVKSVCKREKEIGRKKQKRWRWCWHLNETKEKSANDKCLSRWKLFDDELLCEIVSGRDRKLSLDWLAHIQMGWLHELVTHFKQRY